jgi:hypothetical protein
MSSAILAVPIHGAEDEVLELPKDQLPDDPNEIMQILANELAPLKLWLELAVSYYQQRRIDQFTVVMETSTGEEGAHRARGCPPVCPRRCCGRAILRVRGLCPVASRRKPVLAVPPRPRAPPAQRRRHPPRLAPGHLRAGTAGVVTLAGCTFGPHRALQPRRAAPLCDESSNVDPKSTAGISRNYMLCAPIGSNFSQTRIRPNVSLAICSRPDAAVLWPRAGPFYQDYYKDDKEGRIALLNCLAAYNTTVAARTRNKQVCPCAKCACARHVSLPRGC